MERCRVLWNKVFLLFVYGPLFQTSQENGDQKSRSSDVLRYQRYTEAPGRGGGKGGGGGRPSNVLQYQFSNSSNSGVKIVGGGYGR